MLTLHSRPLAVLFANWADVGHLRWLSILLFLFGVVGIAGNETRVSRLRGSEGLVREGSGSIELKASWRSA